MKMQTRAAQDALRLTIIRDPAGSPAAFSRQYGLDTGNASRVLTRTRPATMQPLCRVTAALDEIVASQLVAAYLCEILAVLPMPYSVVVRRCPPMSRNGSKILRARSPGR